MTRRLGKVHQKHRLPSFAILLLALASCGSAPARAIRGAGSGDPISLPAPGFRGASSQIGTSNQGIFPSKIVEARFTASKPGNPDAAILSLPDWQLVLRRSLGLRRSRPSGELLQAIALVPRRSANCCVVLRQLHGAIGYLQCFRVFLLLVEGQF